MTIWFTSDMHFDHVNVIDYCNRPFRNVDYMNQALIDNWNDLVDMDDVVLVLGDACMGHRDKSLDHISKLRGRKFLVPGNHDYVHPCNGPSRVDKWWDHYTSRFTVYPLYATFPIPNRNAPGEGHLVNLCHMPYADNLGIYDDRDFYKYTCPDDGKWLLHGHVHNQWTVRDRQINVGVDVWDYCPVNAKTIIDIITGA